MNEDRISELRAMCAEYEQKKEACEAAGLKAKAADIASDGVGRRELEALRRNRMEIAHGKLDELMRLRVAATPGP